MHTEYWITAWHAERQQEMLVSCHFTKAMARAKIIWFARRKNPEHIFRIMKMRVPTEFPLLR